MAEESLRLYVPGLVRPKTRIKKKGGVYRGRWGPLIAEVRYSGYYLQAEVTDWFEEVDGGCQPLLKPMRSRSVPKPIAAQGEALGPLLGADKGGMEKKLPELMSWLCDACYTDLKPMGQSMLMLRRRGTAIVATLKIEDQGGLKLEVTDTSPEKALASLEALLSAPLTPWQPDDYPLGTRAKKK